MVILIRFAHSYQDSRLKEKERKGKEIVIITQIFFLRRHVQHTLQEKEMASFLEVNFALCTRQLLIAELL